MHGKPMQLAVKWLIKETAISVLYSDSLDLESEHTKSKKMQGPTTYTL